MELWELMAREGIRDLVARYNTNGDSGRIDALMDLFSDDAVLEVVPDEIYRGKPEIRGLFAGAGESSREFDEIVFIRHFTATHQIDLVDESRARGRCYFVVYTAQGADHWGRYLDAYRRVEDRWLFAERRVYVDARLPGGWAERAHSRRKDSGASG
jgi:ketosteroid isomerase-like protein